MTRTAVVQSATPIETIARYLPDNYSVRMGAGGKPVITGEDVAGWTLDDFVIPRLASGLIWAEEVVGPRSFKVGVKTPGDLSWTSNGVRWPTREQAKAAGADLAARWTAVVGWTVLESTDEPNEE
jgi:hypothetical protein